MDQIQLKIQFSQFKHGPMFMPVLDLTQKKDIFDLKINNDLGYCLPYVDLCETLFDTLLKEVIHHNYILMMQISEQPDLIKFCLEKSITYRDKKIYHLQIDKQNELCRELIQPLSYYLNVVRENIKNYMEKQSKIIPDGLQVNTYNTKELEKKVSTRINMTDLNDDLKKLPILTMSRIYPGPPIIETTGQITIQKHRLDI